MRSSPNSPATAGSRPDRRAHDAWLIRVVGGTLLVDGLLGATTRRGALGRVPGTQHRRLGGGEIALGLALLDRAPLGPRSLYRVVAPLYDALSPIWRDWLYRGPLRAFDAAIASALPGGGDVLDLGCGTGAVLERLLALDARFRTYTGVDLSPEMLAHALARFGHLSGTRFERLDLRSDRLPDGAFDLVVSAWALEHPREPGAVVAVAIARLRLGGRLVLFFELDSHSARGWLIRRVWRFFGVRLVPEAEARSWPGLVALRRFRGIGPDVAVTTIARP